MRVQGDKRLIGRDFTAIARGRPKPPARKPACGPVAWCGISPHPPNNPPSAHNRHMTAARSTAETGARPITVERVTSAADRRAFLDLPRKIYADDPVWIEPLRKEEAKRIDPKRHPFYEHGEGAFWLARRTGGNGAEVIGRIGAVINRLHLEKYDDQTGHFSLLEAIDDQAVFDALFEAAADWLRAKGMRRVLGPFNLSINEELGLLIDGFEHAPMIMMGHARPYYPARVEAAGFAKAKDLYAFMQDLEKPMPTVWRKRLDEILRRNEARIYRATRKTLLDDMHRAIDIYNDAWSENWGALPITARETLELYKAVKPVIAPEAVVFAESKGEPFAIMAAIPNINEAIRDLHGRLLPFGWIKVLWRFRVSRLKSGRIFLLGVRKAYQGTFLGAMMAVLLIENVREMARDYGFRWAELSWVLEDNKKIIDYLEAYGCERYKTYRIYEKAL
jgi:GNAT superfamily N-acetyltransferase